jgi:hypothetical protein
MTTINIIKNNIQNIIKNKKYYDSASVLYSICCMQIINENIDETININNNDHNILYYLSKIKYNNNIISDSYTSISSLSSSLNSNSDIYDQIKDMLEKDNKKLEEVLECDNKNNKQKIKPNFLMVIARKLFNVIDLDKDGYISPCEAIILHEINEKYPLAFNKSLCHIFVYLFCNANNMKINFEQFYDYLII